MRQASIGSGVPVLAIAFTLLCAAAGPARADDPAATLHARFLALQEKLANNQFGRPLFLESGESHGAVSGDVYALVNAPFDSAGTALSLPGAWCDILILHMNTKACRVTGAGQGAGLSLWIGRNQPQALAEAFQVDLAYRVEASSGKYLKVGLNAGQGPMGTRDYRIALEAIPLENGKTFIHLGYSYSYGNVGRLAMQTYFATAGRNKVGFTVVNAPPDGRNRYVSGLRGMVERNSMRYYAAIEVFFGAQSGSPQARFEKRIRDWHAMTELFPRQLHELEREEYLDMKRTENLRFQDYERPRS